MKIINLPTDVLLEISGHLQLADIFSFTSTCTVLHKLSSIRSLWIDALDRTHAVQPLPCPSSQDLTMLDLPSLKHIAAHASNLNRNWSLVSPRIKGAVKEIYCGKLSKIICCVPGTTLIILFSSETENATLWDVSSGMFLSAVFIGRDIQLMSQLYEDRGRCAIALVARSLSWNPNPFLESTLHVLCVDYSGQVPSMRHLFSQNLTPPNESEFAYRAVFLYADVVGLVECVWSAPTARFTNVLVVAWNINTGAQVQIAHELPYVRLGLTCYVLNGDLHLLAQKEHLLNVFRFHHDILPYGSHTGRRFSGDITDCGPFVAYPPDDLRLPPPYRVRQLTFVPGIPQYGVTAASVGVTESLGLFTTTIRFWLAGGGERGASVPGDVENGYTELVKVGRSGALVLLASRHYLERGRYALYLVRYCAERRAVSTHHLEAPAFVDFRDVYSLGVDEHAGRVVLVTQTGLVFCVPYAGGK